jgi:hypothetical protein
MNNPGRHLTLLPPINNASASSGTPYSPRTRATALRCMTAQSLSITCSRSHHIPPEESYRYSDVPYRTGHGGITPPGGNNGNPADYQCAAGGDSGVGYVPTPAGVALGNDHPYHACLHGVVRMR